MKNVKTPIVLAITLLFAVVAYAAGQNPVSVSECMTKEQVLENHARSWQGISLSCDEAIRQRNSREHSIQSLKLPKTGG